MSNIRNRNAFVSPVSRVSLARLVTESQAQQDYDLFVNDCLRDLSQQSGYTDDDLIGIAPALSFSESLNPDDSNNRIGRFSIQPAVDTGQFE